MGNEEIYRIHGSQPPSQVDSLSTVHVVVDREFEHDVDSRLLEHAAAAVLEQEGPFDQAELTVRVTNNEEIQKLNRAFRGVDSPTDVLSFSAGEAATTEDEDSTDFVLPEEVYDQLGDVVISLPVAREQAKEYGHDLRRELSWLTVHGVLQLIGYTHDTPAEAQVMQSREEMALHKLGLSKG